MPASEEATNAIVVKLEGDGPSVSVEAISRSYAPPVFGAIHRFFARFGGIEPGAEFEDDDDDFPDDEQDEEAQFAASVALDRVSLEIAGTGCVAFVGPSASGKSVLLRAIAGVAAPSEGRVVVRGTVAPALATLGSLLPKTGKVARAVPTYARMVRFSGRRARRALPEICELVGDPELATKPMPLLTRRTRNAVILATLLVSEPDIFLLDLELPGTAFDGRFRERLQELKRDALVLVTGRDVESVAWIADHVVTMQRGRLVASHPVAVALERERAEREEAALEGSDALERHHKASGLS
jgi:ABC-type sulfate/molybdate transport systems ATPase subunit